MMYRYQYRTDDDSWYYCDLIRAGCCPCLTLFRTLTTHGPHAHSSLSWSWG